MSDTSWCGTVTPTDNETPPRLDTWLRSQLGEQYSRERLQTFINEGAVLLNGQQCTKASTRLKPGSEIQLKPLKTTALDLKPEAIELPILFEDEQLLVVNKPSGMLTHPSGAMRTGTLVNALLHYCDGQLSGINGVERPGIVHRLDKETSGLLMVAKTEVAHRSLSEQIQQRAAKRRYWAIVQGNPSQEFGTVEAPLGRDPQRRQLQRIDRDKGRFARTHWRVLEQLHGRASWIECELDTGRTHQIRVHMASIGHPLIGDEAYGTGVEKAWQLPTQGQLLQAYSLSFQHPLTKKDLSFTLPLADDLAACLDRLRQH